MDKPKTVLEMLEDIANDICNNYCKYPDQWDEEKNGPLCDSDVCANCPCNRLA
jgi:hypothetical protein